MVKIEKTQYAVHSVELPISKKPVSFRTWNMLEHRMLIMAKESKSPLDMRQAEYQVLTNILVDGTNAAQLPAIEADFIFCKAYSRSVGEIVRIPIINNTTKETKIYPFDVSKFTLDIPKDLNYKIALMKEGKVSKNFLTMKDLTLGDRLEIVQMKEANKNLDEELECVVRCIDKVCDQNECSDANEQRADLKELIQNMTPLEYEPFSKFLIDMPIIYHDIDVSKIFPDIKEVRMVLRGLDDFFEYA